MNASLSSTLGSHKNIQNQKSNKHQRCYDLNFSTRNLGYKDYHRPVFAPAEMNLASRKMYNTHKRAILYVLYGLTLGDWGLLNYLWGKQCHRHRINPLHTLLISLSCSVPGLTINVRITDPMNQRPSFRSMKNCFSDFLSFIGNRPHTIRTTIFKTGTTKLSKSPNRNR